jgi:hypothetical protein
LFYPLCEQQNDCQCLHKSKIQKWLLQLLRAAAAVSPSSSRRLFIPPPPAAAAAAETFRACSAGPLADHFTRTSTHCNSFKVLKTEQQNDMAQSLGVEEANALVAIS